MKAIEAKVVILGTQGVGKTSLVIRYVQKKCTKDIAPTIGASFSTCKVYLSETKIKLQLWDTAGQERFRAMAPMYYRNANAALLIFDISKYSTFVELKCWVHELQKHVLEPMVLTLVGNKCDLDDNRTVSREEAFLYASSIGGHYLETSAVTDQGIEQIFIQTAIGLERLANNSSCWSLKRYESKDSIYGSCLELNEYQQKANSIHMGISVDGTVEANGIGRLEMPSWSIDHIAHGDAHRMGWCCF